ncbi:putative UPF0481 protein [Nymphaea thermarum]|nr:putative UPF0481 protein [Nymphaea thermarum]
MSHRQGSLSSDHGGSFNEDRWIIQIQQVLEMENDDSESECPVSIFNVPAQLLAIKPEAYTPQEISIGPYHWRNPELHEMERFKLQSVRRMQRSFTKETSFCDVSRKFAENEHRIRSCYNRSLDWSGQTIIWMMLLDACFLLEYIQYFAIDPLERSQSKLSPARLQLINYAGKKAAQQLILRDIIMLENQIPFFLLYSLLEMQCGSSAEARLKAMLRGLCKELSPFKSVQRLPEFQVSKRGHLLEVLYYIIIPPKEIPPETADEHKKEDVPNAEAPNPQKKKKKKPVKVIKKKCATCWDCLSNINFSGLIKFVHMLKKLITRCLKLFSPQNIDDMVDGDDAADDAYVDDKKDDGNFTPPSVEEIMIPSVEELRGAGVNFCPASGGITSRGIRFDVKTASLFLPSITLDGNTEVVIRNLVAYEATVAPGALVIARYMELMNGIIDTEEDVKILREKGIIFNHMKSDIEVASMFNSMSKSVRITKVEFLDRVIEDVNRHYGSRWSVKLSNFIKKSVFGSWKILTFLATSMLLLMTGLETLCSVYNCSHWLGGNAGNRFHQQSKTYPGFH